MEAARYYHHSSFNDEEPKLKERSDTQNVHLGTQGLEARPNTVN